MSTFYSVIFIVGVLYTLVSLVLSSVGGVHSLGSHAASSLDLHLGHHGIDGSGLHHGGVGGSSTDSGIQGNSHAGADASLANTMLTWLGILINPMVVVSFLTVFGGLGLMGTNYFDLFAPIVFAGSLTAGTVVSYSMYHFIVLPLYKSENTSHVSKENLLYEVAEVISPIMENGFGEIRYSMNSIRYTAPAKHNKGKAVAQGEKVVICRIEGNVFYVVEFPELEAMDVDSFSIR